MSQPIFKPRTFCGDLAHLPHALLPLTRMRHWVVWRWQARAGKGQVKWTKPPYQIADPNRPAKSNQPDTWGDYADTIPIVAAGNCDGIGFQLDGSHILAVDLDRVRDMTTGQITPRAQRLIAEAANVGGVYIEVTVSGTGIRFIGLSDNAEKVHRRYTLDPATGEAIELYRNCARYITISGLIEGLPPCPVLDVVDGFFERLQAQLDPTPGKALVSGFDFNDAGPQGGEAAYQDLIENGAPQGERSEEFNRTVWHLATQGKSAEEIAEELAGHPAGIGAKYAGRLLLEVQRSHTKWQQQRQASATGGAPAPAGAAWPQIRVVASELPRVIDEAEEALLLYGAEVYQRGGLMVRPVLTRFEASNRREAMGWHLIPVTRPWLVNTLTCAARFWRYNGRSSTWMPVDAPDKVADIYLSRRGAWKLPVLAGLIHHPFLRADGSLNDVAGYDQASGLLFKPEGESYPSVPSQPSKSDAAVALERLAELIREFPFVQDKDRSVALSAILTTLDRRSMPTAPLHAFTAPTAGTGKSLMVDICAMLATGRPMPVISQGHTEEELEKRLGAALLAGDTAISLDNCEHEIGGSFLCQVLTQQHLNIRILGLSRNAETPANATIFATGNNLVIAGDATRRTLSAILTTLDRRSMPTAPLHAFTAPTAGTGKSLMVDICAMLATGRPMPVISQGHTEEELEKRLGAALLAGDTAISLDNCEHEIGGSFLCQVLTQQHLNIRILGLSRNAETPANATIFATGNNLVIAGDATRRTLLSAMDAGLERPETRVFSNNVIDVVRHHRGELVAAALTVLRAWHVAGEKVALAPFGSFDEWSRRIREPLVWLGYVDPCETLLDVRKSDPRRDALIAVLMQWESCLGTNHKHTVQQVIGRAINEPTFHTALVSVAGGRAGQLISNVMLGRWLKRVEGKITNGLALVQDGMDCGYPLWKLDRR